MRVALVSPYSHGYPGGVARHVEGLAEELLARGHEATLLAPHDPDDRLTRLLHGGRGPGRRDTPDYLLPLGRTLAVPANGARSNLACTLDGVARLSRALRGGRFDVVHVHEPNAPLASWCAVELARAPLVGTFHAHSTSRPVNLAAANVLGARRLYNRLGVRIAVSEAARWTAQRFYGGRYRVVPNGVDLAAARRAGGERSARAGPVRLLYLGRAEERKGLPVLVRAFELLRSEGVGVRLTVAGAEASAARALVLDPDAGVEIVGPVPEHEKWRLLAEADVVCAPSLGGESFGMVLVEALAAGTPVVCSDIPGYREIVRHGEDGLLVSPGRPEALARAVSTLAGDPPRRARMAEAAQAHAERFAWPRVADEVVAAYEDAMALPVPASRPKRAAACLGLRPADAEARAPGDAAKPTPRPGAPAPNRVRGRSRTGGWLGAAAAAALTALLLAAPGSISLDGVGRAVLSAPTAALMAAALMSLSLLVRAEAWHAILRASLGRGSAPDRAAAARATMIGVLMSASLPARLGEVARALVLARTLGRVRDRLPLVAGTIVSQSVLNLLALGVLGTAVLASAGLAGATSEDRLALVTVAPAGALLAVVAGGTFLVRARAAGDLRPLAGLSAAVTRLRRGLAVFRAPRLGAYAAVAQLTAWMLQLLACQALLVGAGLGAQVGLAGAAAVLFAVNAAGALPGLPSNVGVFQAACVVALAAYGVGYGHALAYGLALQALELTVAVALGVPALVREGVGWRALRDRALHAAPVAVPD